MRPKFFGFVISLFLNAILRKIAVFIGIQTLMVRVDYEHADHMTTTKARGQYGFNLFRSAHYLDNSPSSINSCQSHKH